MNFLQMVSSPRANGAIMHAARFSRLLKTQGHEVTVAAPPDSWIAEQLGGDVEVIALPFQRNRANLARAAEICRQRQFDVTQSHQTGAHHFGCKLERLTGIPHLAQLHSQRWQWHWFFQRRVLALTASAALTARRRYFLRETSVAVVPNYVDIGSPPATGLAPDYLSKTLELPSDSQVIACVAEITPRKGQLYLIQSLPAVFSRHPHARVVLLGRDDRRPGYTATVRTAAQQLGITDRVIWAGFRNDVPALLPHCHLAVLPSLDEPFALGGLESMACGLPLIATRVGGFPDMIVDGQTGLLVPPRKSAPLAVALNQLLDDEPARQRMATAARARIQEHFTAQAHLRHFTAALRSWNLI